MTSVKRLTALTITSWSRSFSCWGFDNRLYHAWICDFLTNRRQAVAVDGCRSDWALVNGGVPQGTKLGPILFLVMINDLELKSLLASYWKYVDDVTVSEVRKAHESSSSLQADHDEISRWGERYGNDMKLNGKKCKEMTASFATAQKTSPSASMTVYSTVFCLSRSSMSLSTISSSGMITWIPWYRKPPSDCIFCAYFAVVGFLRLICG